MNGARGTCTGRALEERVLYHLILNDSYATSIRILIDLNGERLSIPLAPTAWICELPDLRAVSGVSPVGLPH